MLSRSSIIGLTVVVLTACGGSDATSPSASTLSGNWAGSFASGEINATLLDNSGTVSGTGTFIEGTLSVAETVTGARVGRSFTLDFASAQYQPFTVTGQINAGGQSITGAMKGSGFTGDSVTFTRQ